jgi:sugar fermentation stimulation protein A
MTDDATAPSRKPVQPSRDGFPVRFPRERELLEGRLVRRYKRFLADVELPGGEVVTAHCANTGAMEGLTGPGLRVWVSRSENPKRKLAYTWELAQGDERVGHRIFGAHTATPNRLVRRLLEGGHLPWLQPFDELAAERRYGERSRIDFWLRSGGEQTYIEVKNCHLVYPDGRAYFPDAVSARAARHLEELAAMVEQGHRAEVLFVCQTGPVEAVRPSDVHDPRFAATARRVAAAGVGFSAVTVTNTPEEIVVEGTVPVDLEPYPTGPVEGFREGMRGG